ncbi:GumC family protein [Thermodesulfobacteriota bacterium]
MEINETEQSPHLSEYYYILSKHKWTIIAILIIIVTLAMINSFFTKPVYRATSTLIIEKDRNRSPITGESLDYESFLSQSVTINTQVKLITSRLVLKKVAQKLHLDRIQDQDEFHVSPARDILTQVKKNIRLLMGKKDINFSTEEKISNLADSLRGKINIELVRDTILLNINVEDHDPALARDIANAVAEMYIEFNISNRLKYSQNTLAWMTDQLYEVKKKLEDSEAEFLAYKQREKLFSVEGRQDVNRQKIEEFNNAYLDMRNKRMTLDAKLAELKKNLGSKQDIYQIRSLLDNSLINTLYSQMLDLEVELSSLSKVYRSKHPKVIQIITEIENTRNKLKQEIDKEHENLESERSVLLAREEVMQKTISDFENDALDINKKELKYTILNRNVVTNQNLYDAILSKVKEADITGNIDASNIRVTEEAVLPTTPIKPNKKRTFVLSIFLGLFLGAGIAFLWEYLDRSIRNEEDAARYLDLPVIAIVPIADKKEP